MAGIDFHAHLTLQFLSQPPLPFSYSLVPSPGLSRGHYLKHPAPPDPPLFYWPARLWTVSSVASRPILVPSTIDEPGRQPSSKSKLRPWLLMTHCLFAIRIPSALCHCHLPYQVRSTGTARASSSPLRSTAAPLAPCRRPAPPNEGQLARHSPHFLFFVGTAQPKPANHSPNLRQTPFLFITRGLK